MEMKVGELAAMTGVSVRSLRYYEQQGLLEPHRTPAGHRVYTIGDQALVKQIQDLFRAGFCSSVIRELLPALTDTTENEEQLRASFAAAQARLESEKRAIEIELARLQQLRTELGVASDMHVTPQDKEYESSPTSQAAAFDHRDRRLR